MRILHLTDPGHPGGGAHALKLLSLPLERLTRTRQDVLVFGTRRHVALARRCGVEPCGHFHAPGADLGGLATVTAAGGLRRWVAAQERAGGRYDIVHAATARVATLARRALPRHCLTATMSVGPVSRLAAIILRRQIEKHPMSLLATSSAVAAEYVSLGIPEAAITVLPPGVDMNAVDGDARAHLRERWGVDRETVVIGVLSEPVTWADAKLAVNVAARVDSAGRKVKVIVHPQAHRRADAEHFLRRFAPGEGRELMHLEPDLAEPWRVMAGIDVALLIGGPLNVVDLGEMSSPLNFVTGGGRRLRPMPGVLPLVWAMAAGKPVVAERSSAVMDVVRDAENGLLVPQFDINAAADRVLRICDDRTVAARLGSEAFTTARDAFNHQSYCAALMAHYEGLVWEPEPDAAGVPERREKVGEWVIEA